MPIKNKFAFQGPTPEPSFLDRLGGWRGAAGAGIRAVSGVAAAPGGWEGAGIGGLGELGAELAEGSDVNLKRIGVEAGLGAVPFGAILKEGRPVASAIRGAAHSGVGSIGRQLAETGTIDPSTVGVQAATGGVLTGALAKLFGKAAAPLAKPLEPIIETTAHKGGRTLGVDGKLTDVKMATSGPPPPPPPSGPSGPSGGSTSEGGIVRPEGPSVPPEWRGIPRSERTPPSVVEPWSTDEMEDMARFYEQSGDHATARDIRSRAYPAAVTDSRVPVTGEAPPVLEAKDEERVGSELARTLGVKLDKIKSRHPGNLKQIDQSIGEVGKEVAARHKQVLADEEAAIAADAVARAKEGLLPGEPGVTESYTTKVPGGTERATTRWSAPTAEEDGLDGLSGGHEADMTRAAEGDEHALARLLKVGRRVGDVPDGRAGQIYNDWLQRGKTPKEALKLAAKGRPHVDSGIPGVTGETNGVIDMLPDPAAAESVPQSLGAAAPGDVSPMPPPPPDPTSPGRAMTPGQRAREASYNELLAKLKGEQPIAKPATGEVAPIGPETPPVPTTVASNVASDAPAAESALARFFKSRPDALGSENPFGYQATQMAVKAGEADKLGFKPEAARILGAGLRREAQAAGLPTGKAAKAPEMSPGGPSEPVVTFNRPQEAPTPPGAVEASGDVMQQLRETAHQIEQLKAAGVPQADIGESLGLIDRLRRLNRGEGGPKGGGGTTLGSGLGGLQDILGLVEKHPEYMAKLGMGAAGAAIGAAVNPLDNRAASAAAGFAGGVTVAHMPQMIASLGGQVPDRLAELVRSPEGIKEAASKVWRTLPQVQRFNYLADMSGLPANMFAGPYGSAVMASIEHGLSGDPRGWKALKTLTPRRFWEEWKASRQTAEDLLKRGEIGRAEGQFELPHAMQAPSIGMTAGDEAARRILMESGFSEEEVRRITMTNEPESPAFKSIAEFGKNSPMWQMLFPFRRTPANIGEQGAQRMPGLGSILQSKREVPDSVQQQFVQQFVMTPTIAGTAGMIGNNLTPEQAKIARRFVTNGAGQYSLAAGLGFTAGQALRADRDPTESVIRGAADALPLPTVQPAQDWWRWLSHGAQLKSTGAGKVPRGAIPSVVYNNLLPAESTGPLPRIKRIR